MIRGGVYFDASVSLGRMPPHHRRYLHDRMIYEGSYPHYPPFGVGHNVPPWQYPLVVPPPMMTAPVQQPPVYIIQQPAPVSIPAPAPAFKAAAQPKARAPEAQADAGTPDADIVDLRDLRRLALQSMGYSFEDGAKKHIPGDAWSEMLHGGRTLPDDAREAYQSLRDGAPAVRQRQAPAAGPVTQEEFLAALLLSAMLTAPADTVQNKAAPAVTPAPAPAPAKKDVPVPAAKAETPAAPPAPEKKKTPAAVSAAPATPAAPTEDPDTKMVVIRNPDGSYTLTSPKAERTFQKMKEDFEKSAKPGKAGKAAPQKKKTAAVDTGNDMDNGAQEVLSGQGRHTRLDAAAKDGASDSLSRHMALLKAYHLGPDMPSLIAPAGPRMDSPRLS